MLQSTTLVPLHRAQSARQSFLQLHVTPLWQRTQRAVAVAAEVWRDARALEREMLPRRHYE